MADKRDRPDARWLGPLLRGIAGQAVAAAGAMALLPVANGPAASAGLERLIAAYPNHLARIEGNVLVWKDGTRMPIDDGKGEKSFADWLAAPDIKDMLAIDYRPGGMGLPPARNADPGRARNAAFFNKMYGDCTKGEVDRNLVEITWLPRKAGQKLKVTRVNGVADRLREISRELDALPSRYDPYLVPSAGTYLCRPIAGTSRMSAHGHGIAIDIAVGRAHYWRWSGAEADGTYKYRNAVPLEIVRIFERHGFIWGGAWYHFDTMHFEYRPELLK